MLSKNIKSLLLLFILLFLVGCGKPNDVNFNQVDEQFGKFYNAMADMEYSAISISGVDSLEQIYLSHNQSEVVAECRLIKGAKYYSVGDNVQALRCLKAAEQHLSSESFDVGYLLYYLSRVLAVDNPQQSKYYAQRLADWSVEREHPYLLAMSNKLLMNLSDNINSALHYRLEAVENFSIVADSLMVEKTNARFAIKFIEQLPLDSAEALISPFYNRVGYARDADALATVYLLNQRAEEALPYIQKLASAKGFEFQYYNNMAVYYSQLGEFEKSLIVYDSAFHIYQQQAETILAEQIARVNGEYDKKLYDQQLELQRYRTLLLVVLFVFVALCAIALIVWLMRIIKRNRQKNLRLKAENEKLEVANEELVDTSKKQSQKLYAVSDICKQTYASIVLANPETVKVISRTLFDNLRDTYPHLSNMDFTYMFLDFIGLNAKDICHILSVQEGTYYCRRSAIKKKLGTDAEQDIDEIFNQFFLGPTIREQGVGSK